VGRIWHIPFVPLDNTGNTLFSLVTLILLFKKKGQSWDPKNHPGLNQWVEPWFKPIGFLFLTAFFGDCCYRQNQKPRGFLCFFLLKNLVFFKPLKRGPHHLLSRIGSFFREGFSLAMAVESIKTAIDFLRFYRPHNQDGFGYNRIAWV